MSSLEYPFDAGNDGTQNEVPVPSGTDCQEPIPPAPPTQKMERPAAEVPVDAELPSKRSEPQPPLDDREQASEGVDESLGLPTVNDVVELAKKSGIKCFHDEIGRSFAEIIVASPELHRETWAISPKCKPVIAWLRSQAKQHFGVFLPKKLITAVLEVLDHDADVGQMIPLGNRLAHEDGKLFIDLVDTTWQVIEIRSDGWSVTQPDRPLFWRNRHQLSLPVPVGGGSVELTCP